MIIYLPNPFRRCTTCRQEFPRTPEYFYSELRVSDGCQSKCKTCICIQNDEWDAKHPGHKHERTRAWQRKHPDRVRAAALRWLEKNPYYKRVAEQKRTALKNAAPGEHTDEDIVAQYERQKGRCYWCGKYVGDDFEVDHVIALTRGGSNGSENIVIACPRCNQSKHNKLPHEWKRNGGKLL